MRAVAVRHFRDAPAVMEVAVPVPAPHELGVRLEAAGINPFDWKISDGILDGHRPHTFPLVLGVDGAGVVESTGSDVRRYRVGDRVFGQFLHDPVGIGTYAEHSTVPETIGIAAIPAGLGFADAAAVPTAGMTALTALDALQIPRGGTLLVVGASGGVGSFATQFGHAAGLRVIAAGRPASHDRLRSLGASATLDPTTGAISDQARTIAPGGVDGLLDVVSDKNGFARSVDAVRPGGRATSTVYAADPGGRGTVITTNLDLHPTAEVLSRVARIIAEGRLRVPLERTIPLDDAPKVVEEGRGGRLAGKTVIRL